MVLKIAYILLTILTNLFLIFIGFKAINSSKINVNKNKLKLTIGLIAWQLFILTLSSISLLKSYDFPPRFALAFIIPSFVFTGIFLYRNKSKSWLKAIPEHWIVYFQSFRIAVETLFVFSLADGIFNPQVTIEGYNFDMIFAFSAPIIAFLVYNKQILSKKAILIWNYLGLLVLASVIFLFLASMYKPILFGSSEPILPLISMTYPYVLIGGFLMPAAVFLHCLSIIQVKVNAVSSDKS